MLPPFCPVPLFQCSRLFFCDMAHFPAFRILNNRVHDSPLCVVNNFDHLSGMPLWTLAKRGGKLKKSKIVYYIRSGTKNRFTPVKRNVLVFFTKQPALMQDGLAAFLKLHTFYTRYFEKKRNRLLGSIAYASFVPRG